MMRKKYASGVIKRSSGRPSAAIKIIFIFPPLVLSVLSSKLITHYLVFEGWLPQLCTLTTCLQLQLTSELAYCSFNSFTLIKFCSLPIYLFFDRAPPVIKVSLVDLFAFPSLKKI